MALTEAEQSLKRIEQVERAGLKAWPALQSSWDGDWVCRTAKGYTKRANSIQCMDPSDAEHAERRLQAMSEQMAVHNLRPTFRQTPLSPPGMEHLLDELGWDRFEPSQIRILSAISRPLEVIKKVEAQPATDPGWYKLHARMSDLSGETRDILTEILTLLPQSSRALVAYADDGQPAATCLVMIVDGVAIFTNVVTDPAFRRQGLAAALMAAGLNFARQKGATMSSIHVLADNAAAISLYDRFGFAHAGDYVYRRAPL